VGASPRDDGGASEGEDQRGTPPGGGGAMVSSGEPDERPGISQAELDLLLAVATLYADAFDGENELMTLPGKLMLQDVEAVLQRHGRRY
jgi:hypothetical protein